MKNTYMYFFFASMTLYFVGTLSSILIAALREESELNAKKHIIITSLGTLAFVTHTVYLALRWNVSNHAPMANLHETLTFFAWCLAGINLACYIQYQKNIINCLSHIVIITLTTISFLSPHDLTPLYPVLQTIWFELHVSSAFIAYAFFTICAVSAVSSLVHYRGDDFLLFDEITEKCARWGLLIFSVSTVTGGIWAFLAWSDYWVWTPKEMWTIVLWLYYATYLHLRLRTWWRGRPVNIFAAFGLAVMLFTYLGVSVIMNSSHNM